MSGPQPGARHARTLGVMDEITRMRVDKACTDALWAKVERMQRDAQGRALVDSDEWALRSLFARLPNSVVRMVTDVRRLPDGNFRLTTGREGVRYTAPSTLVDAPEGFQKRVL